MNSNHFINHHQLNHSNPSLHYNLLREFSYSPKGFDQSYLNHCLHPWTLHLLGPFHRSLALHLHTLHLLLLCFLRLRSSIPNDFTSWVSNGNFSNLPQLNFEFLIPLIFDSNLYFEYLPRSYFYDSQRSQCLGSNFSDISCPIDKFSYLNWYYFHLESHAVQMHLQFLNKKVLFHWLCSFNSIVAVEVTIST